MQHEPAAHSAPDHSIPYKMRIGVYVFIIYAVIYAGFVVINLANPLLMEKIVFLGLNLAMVYGFGLIIFALFLALIYNHLCAAKENGAISTATEEAE